MLLRGSVAGEAHPLGWAGPQRWPGLGRALMPLQSRKRAGLAGLLVVELFNILMSPFFTAVLRWFPRDPPGVGSW